MGKSFIRTLVNAARRDRLTYNSFVEDCKIARQQLGLKRPSRFRHLPQLIPEDALRKFYNAVDQTENLCHQIMLRLLLFTGLRVSELVAIEVTDVDLSSCKIFIRAGKGDKDRYVLLPTKFRLVLQTYLKSCPENRYLFESRLKSKFSTRQIRYIVKEYAEKAGIDQKVHPHLFRHALLTFLTKEGLSDAQIQLISGHSSKKSLEVYQHLGLHDVQSDYQQAIGKLEI
jgi:site-specific recombinase XerD